MKKLIFFAFLLCALTSKAQLQTFILENSTSTTQYDNLDSALSNAQTGDILYLPAGVISFSRYITKSITIIGAGAHPDSTTATGQTIITTTPTTIQNVSNFTMTGVYIQGNLEVKNSSNVLISRCILGKENNDQLEIYGSN